MEETNTGAGRRLVLGFDAGCMTCSDLAERIKLIVGDRLEVLSLHEPQVEQWRARALGIDAPWACTLMEINGLVVRAWTGARMCARLASILGPVLTLRLMQTIVVTKMASPAASGGSAESTVLEGRGIDREQFIKRLGSGAIVAGVTFSGIGGLSSAASAASGASTLGSRSGDCFVTRAERRRFDRAVEIVTERLRVTTNGTLQINDGEFADAVEAGQAEGVPRAVFRELASSIDAANEHILEGNLHSTSELISPGIQQITDTASGQTSARACRGRSGRSVHWWGIRMRLNSCQTNTLIYYCTIEAGAASLCKRILVIPCKIAAFVLLVQCATFQRAAAPGRGIVIDKSWGLRLPRVYSQ